MIRLQALLQFLNQELQPERFTDRSVNGLQVEGCSEIRRLATAVSASEETIAAAVSQGFDALLVHHGLFWADTDYRITQTLQRKLKLCLDNNLSLLAYHLPLDAHPEFGNNWCAAKELGWQTLAPFGQYKETRIGVRGTLPSLPIAKFQKDLESYYGQPAHTALGGKKTVEKVALVSGGSHWSILEAVDAGMDAFVTGTFDEPIWHIAKEERIHFLALGHSATEKIGPRATALKLASHASIETTFLDLPNPF